MHRFPVLLLTAFLCAALVGSASADDPLRKLARRRHVRVGSAVSHPTLTSDPSYAQVLAREFDVVTPENEMKWGIIHPTQDVYDFTKADEIVEFASQNGMRVRGHTLVWHQQNPAWLTSGSFTRDEWIEILRNHIHTVAGRYRGKVYQWDVVNEAFGDFDGNLRNTLWLQAIGPEYIELAFRFANEAAPRAKLYYNDFLTELQGPKFEAVLALAADLKQRGVPIHGVGFQAHAFLGGTGCSTCFDTLQTNLLRVAALRLDVALTELDVMIPQPTTPAALTTQAELYRKSLDACMRVRRCRTYVVWGFTDRRSWIPFAFPGYDDATLFDRDLLPKPAYFAVQDRLRELRTPRP